MQKMQIISTPNPTCPAWEHMGHPLEGEVGPFCSVYSYKEVLWVDLQVIFIYDFVLFCISHILFEHKFIL